MSVAVAVALALTATTLFGLSAVLLKIGVTRGLPELTLAGVVRHPWTVAITLARNPAWLAGMGLQLVGGVFYLIAVARLDITIVKPVITLYVLLAAVLGVVFLREALAWRERVGVGVAVLGALLLALFGEAATGSATNHSADTAVMWFLLGGDLVLSAALGGPLLATGGRRSGSRELVLSLVSGLNWGLGAVYWKILVAEVQAVPGDWWSSAALWLSPTPWITAFLNVGGFVVYLVALARGRVAVIAPVVMIATLVGPLTAGGLVFGEALPPLKLLGIGAAIAGTALLASSRSTEDRPR